MRKFNKGDTIKLLRHSPRYNNEALVIGDRYILDTVGVKLAIIKHNNNINIIEFKNVKLVRNKLSKHILL